ncbi:beta-1,3-galactosyltransferase brn-like [Mizuhopecten yessoensis]|uniref:Hexosyltransferase n=1 Tax=Mizuhopecten yessoensis TaxID=6573 RepID=A0A210R3X9_MIZYE|nr:beta-1,3-galactosyltransferase brn-like [Mizuhopecten yessoensis]OWF55614.1 Beta-1,3-galactosyltransferase brn [Mizuhopecten yessoensis]
MTERFIKRHNCRCHPSLTPIIVRLYVIKMFQRRGLRYMPLIIVAITMYLAFHVQQDIRFMMNKRDLRNDNSSLLSVRTTTELMPFLNNTALEEIFIPNISFPLDIDLENAVKDKIENGIKIPHRPINVIRRRYIYRPPACQFSNTTEDIPLLILVKSSIRNVFLRDAIRETWGKDLGESIKIFFLLGTSTSMRDTIVMESDAYNDIIMGNFVDAYSNNTLKSIMGFNWAVNECSTADMILFIDDDHLPNMHNILSYLHSFDSEQLDDMYCGYRLNKGQVYRGRNRWGILRFTYPYQYWPPYLRGGAYLISQKIAKKFSIAFPYVKLIHVDDSYLGIVSLKLNILPQHDVRFMMDKQEIGTQKRFFVFNDYKKPKEFKKDWKIVTNQI